MNNKMELNLKFRISFFIVLTSSLINLVSCYCPATNQSLFVFGDSYVDSGNSNYYDTPAKANYAAYGNSFFKYSNGRFSDGRLIPDFIADYMNLPYPSPYLQGGNGDTLTYGFNFASTGAGALAETHRKSLNPKDLKTQLGYFKDVANELKQEWGDAQSKKMISKAIYLFNIGSCDYLVPFYANSSLLQTYSKNQYVAMVIGNTTDVVKEIYKAGGRKFVFINLGPLGSLPYTIAMYPKSNGTNVEEANQLAKQHNRALSSTLLKLQKKLVGFKFAIHNLYLSLTQLMKNPSNYGFVEGEKPCCVYGYSYSNRSILNCGGNGGYTDYGLCKNPSSYVFFDTFHLSEKTHEKIAEQIWNGPRNVTMPINLKTLLG